MIAFTNTPSTIMLPIDQIIFLLFDITNHWNSNNDITKETITHVTEEPGIINESAFS